MELKYSQYWLVIMILKSTGSHHCKEIIGLSRECIGGRDFWSY